MTLRQSNIDRMLQLGFDDRLAMMIEHEAEHRDHKSYLGHLRQAQLRIRADLQDVDYRARRGIARTNFT
ncbi:MAG: ATP-binding protein [Alphaproteobacteria bacterium]|nr:ATP-binding protein [Alphaproteobacteria bacterium]MCY3754272.1 ATP-binding protein [Alphaproteobacteria bacterium]